MIKNRLFLFLFAISLFWMPIAHSQSTFAAQRLFFSAGNYSDFFRKTQIDNNGGTRNFNYSPFLSAGAEFSLPKTSLLFAPEVLWVLTRDVEQDKIILPFAGSANVTRNIWMFRFGTVYPITQQLRLRTSISNVFTMISGKGGTIQLENGGGSSSFFVPDQTRTAINNTFDLGLEYKMSSKWGIRGEVIIFSLLKKEARQYSHVLSLTYYWDNAFQSMKGWFK